MLSIIKFSVIVDHMTVVSFSMETGVRVWGIIWTSKPALNTALPLNCKISSENKIVIKFLSL